MNDLNKFEMDEYIIFVMRLTCTKYEEPYVWHLVSEYGEDEHFYCPNCDAERKTICDIERDEYHSFESLGYVTLGDMLEKVRKDE